MPREWRPTPKQQRFIELILTGTMDQGRCYREAYQSKASDRTCSSEASVLAANPNIARAIAHGRQEVVQSIALGHSDLVRLWSEAITTDRNELHELRRVPCRYCWSPNGEYQERKSERDMRHRAHQELLKTTPEKEWKRIPPFDDMGGTGYTTKKPPNADCTNCDGDGEERVYLHDTRRLSPAARALFEGIDVKNGAPVIKTRSRDTAEDRLAKHYGMFIDRSLVLTAQLQPKTLAEFYGQLPRPTPAADDTDT